MIMQVWLLGVVPALLLCWGRCAQGSHRHTVRVGAAFFVALCLVPAFSDLNNRLIQEPFVDAARRGDTAAVARYLRWGANINEPAEKEGGTALIAAVAGKHPATVRLLIDRGADVNHAEWYSAFPLRPLSPLVAAQDHPEIAPMLKEAGAER